MTSPKNVTLLLLDWSNGDRTALDELMHLVYDELHQIAGCYLRRERPDHTIQPTALVHEAYMRLIDQKSVQWQNRAHFFGIAARLMRQILVNHALAHQAEKRGGKRYKLSLSEVVGLAEEQDMSIVALDEALKNLEAIDARKSQIVELRFFSGLSLEEVAEVLGISLATVKREWRMARAWLHAEIQKGEAS